MHKVYVIHGYGSHPMLMRKICKSLEKEGYEVKNYGYASYNKDLIQIGEELYSEVLKSGADTISFVTHSMGALVLRSMYRNIKEGDAFPTIERIVMIAPPNKGAEIADFYAKSKILRPFLGPNIRHLCTNEDALSNQLPVPQGVELGIIAGHSQERFWFKSSLKTPNDGFLSCERTKLGVEKAWISLPIAHNALKRSPELIRAVISFLKEGVF